MDTLKQMSGMFNGNGDSPEQMLGRFTGGISKSDGFNTAKNGDKLHLGTLMTFNGKITDIWNKIKTGEDISDNKDNKDMILKLMKEIPGVDTTSLNGLMDEKQYGDITDIYNMIKKVSMSVSSGNYSLAIALLIKQLDNNAMVLKFLKVLSNTLTKLKSNLWVYKHIPLEKVRIIILSAILEACSEGALTPFITELAPLLDKILCSNLIDSLIKIFSDSTSLTSCVENICEIQIVSERCGKLKEYLLEDLNVLQNEIKAVEDTTQPSTQPATQSATQPAPVASATAPAAGGYKKRKRNKRKTRKTNKRNKTNKRKTNKRKTNKRKTKRITKRITKRKSRK